MKKIFWIAILFVFCFVGCAGTSIPRPEDANLEFWITQEVTLEDFEGYQENYGWFGAHEYYGKGYEPTMSETNEQIDPEYCVKYKVTNYPDYSSSKLAVTGITITDPTITFYGLSLTSTHEEIIKTMEGLGYTVDDEVYLCAQKGSVEFRFHDTSIHIVAEVTNKYGIIF